MTIGSDLEYAGYVNDGTPRHWIYPKARRTRTGRPPMLRFQVGGETVFARAVNHPGTKPNPFLDRALREVAAARGYSFRVRS